MTCRVSTDLPARFSEVGVSELLKYGFFVHSGVLHKDRHQTLVLHCPQAVHEVYLI